MRVEGKFDAKAFLTEQMTRAQGLRLKRLSEEAYQPGQLRYLRANASLRKQSPS